MTAVENGSAEPQSALIFLGTGCSSAVPNALCLIRPSDPPCSVCSQSLTVPPEQNPNYRCNTSLLVDYFKDNGEHKYILIDVGKTFREQVLRWFTRYKIPQVDSIILTHEHADATLGLDDIRAVQPFSPTNDINPTPVYLTQYSMDSINQKFPYLVQKKLKEGQEIRRVAQLDWQIIENDCEKSFVASGLEFVPLPVMHGEDYVCLGFLFGRNFRVAYISDVSRFLPTTVSCEYYLYPSIYVEFDLDHCGSSSFTQCTDFFNQSLQWISMEWQYLTPSLNLVPVGYPFSPVSGLGFQLLVVLPTRDNADTVKFYMALYMSLLEMKVAAQTGYLSLIISWSEQTSYLIEKKF